MKVMAITGEQALAKWNEIANAMIAAGIRPDPLAYAALVMGAAVLRENLQAQGVRIEQQSLSEKRQIGFAPPITEGH
jgi:hypothetical protein